MTDLLQPQRNHFWQGIASRFPTHRIRDSRLLGALWRALFYLVRPSEPFKMHTGEYQFWAEPSRDSLSRSVIRRGGWEPIQTQAMKLLLNHGDVVVDGGANFGHFTMIASAAVGTSGRVYAFEPYPPTYRMLERNAALQPHSNIRLFNCALDERSGKTTLFVDTKNPGGHSLGAANVDEPGADRTVRTVSIDELVDSNQITAPIAVLKTDCQGAEPRILRGAKQSVATSRPFLFLEFWPHGMRNSNEDHEAFFSELGELGYVVYEMDDKTDAIAGADLVDMMSQIASAPRKHFDILCVPSEKAGVEARLLQLGTGRALNG